MELEQFDLYRAKSRSNKDRNFLVIIIVVSTSRTMALKTQHKQIPTKLKTTREHTKR